MHKIKLLLIFLCINLEQSVSSYTLPAQLGLGTSSFLDGGPLRQVPGWYWQNITQVYHSNRFNDVHGRPLPGIRDPNLNFVATAVQFIFLSQRKLFGGSLGFEITLPLVLHADIRRNNLPFISSGGGLGDLVIGAYLQFDPIFMDDRPIFVHRLEFVTIFPTGKNKLPEKTINPGSRIFYYDPYWAATIFFSKRLNLSWRLHYLWCETNHVTHIKPGQAIHFNYAIGYVFSKKFICGINGYYLRQLTASTLNGIKIPDSKEQVFAIGPGAAWVLARRYRFVIFANLYFEMDVRNRAQGIRATFRILKHF